MGAMRSPANWFRLWLGVCLYLGLALTTPATAQTAGAEAKVAPASGKTAVIFAVSWQPGFCEIRPERPECKSLTADSAEAGRFSLHGLWPIRKSYCGVAAEAKALDRKGAWLELPALSVTKDTAEKLAASMPGVKSGLDRHQWLRSGTCGNETADRYFTRQLRYLDELNGSAVRRLFAGRIGTEVTEAEVKLAFASSFGPSSGERVRMRCQKDGSRQVVTGLTIGLAADPSDNGALRPLMEAAGATAFKCTKGIVDAAGPQ